jgi:Holliday junction resolvase
VSNYSRGHAFELRARARLESEGWFVGRSAGSKTPVDLVAIKANSRPLLVQCKSGTRSLSERERSEFADFARRLNAMPVLCTRGLKFEAVK